MICESCDGSGLMRLTKEREERDKLFLENGKLQDILSFEYWKDKSKEWKEYALFLKSQLQKIDDPMKYHHWEEDPYTRAGCFQFVAQEALKKKEPT